MMRKIYILIFSFFSFSAVAQTVDNHIKIDQFGYTTNAQKIAIISNPQTGYNSTSPFTPGTNYEVRMVSDNSTVYTGTLILWENGITHTQSGDKVWWFDFSSVTSPGTYYIYDVTNNVKSYDFDIDDCVYEDVLKAGLRTFYYQRCGIAKSSPYAGTGWTDAICHTGTQQDTDCRLYNNTSASTTKNLSGGWHDAGDYNKYVNFAWEGVLNMLLAYEENPSAWGDDCNLPESGNGVADILDEVKYELDWLLKMQNADGSVLSVVGGGTASPPSSDNTYRRYGPATTAASLSSAGMFALGAIQFKAIGNTTYATTLQTAAVNAWNWAIANPSITFRNTDNGLAAGEQELNNVNERNLRKLCAASYLYALTGTSAYKTFFDSYYTTNANYWYAWTYAYPYEHVYQDAMLYYSKATGATSTVANNIKTRYTTSVKNHADNYKGFTDSTDAYRAYLNDGNYSWGSNRTKCDQASMYLTMNHYGLDAVNNTGYKNAASGFVHYMHGVNPNAFTYLSNMGSYGAENSINEFYHGWFENGSALWDRVGISTYGPAPGFVPGGPNPGYNVDNCCLTTCGNASADALCNTSQVTPPLNQPIQKSYKDWNTSWPQNSWEITENSQSYQASYIRLLSQFACNAPPLGVMDRAVDDTRVVVYPNPTNASFTVKVELDKNVEVEIIVYNAIGKAIFSIKESGVPGTYLKPVPSFAEQPAGLYFVHVKAGEIKSIERLIKVNQD